MAALLMNMDDVQPEFLDLGVHTWAIDQMSPFSVYEGPSGEARYRNEQEKARQMLPIKELSRVPGNPQYLVNLIKLAPEKEGLRDTVFWNIFRMALLFDNLE